MQAGIYQHYKGGFYQVLGVAQHTETGEEMVVYVSLDATLPGPRMRVRPLHGENGFETTISEETHGTIKLIRTRFHYVGDKIPTKTP